VLEAGRPAWKTSEAWLFRGGAALLALHAVDEAAINPWPGTNVGDRLTLIALAAIALVVASVYPRLPAVLRALLVFVFAPAAGTGAAMHILDARWNGARGADYSGFLLVLAAAAFVTAAVLAVLSRPRARSWPARIGRSVAGVLLTLLLAGYISFPIGIGIAQTQKPPRDIPADAFAIDHEDVVLRTGDGLRVRGWYVPSENRAAIVVVHGGGGDRLGSRRHAAMLARRGYGVLLYDARGRGESEGAPNALGWSWPADVDAALDYLSSRRDVDPRRIGGLGLSTGADVLIEVAGRNPALRAVILDGATIWTVRDTLHVGGVEAAIGAPFSAVYIGTVALVDQALPPQPLAELAERIPPKPALFIASNDLNEPVLNAEYTRAYGDPGALWHVDAAHTQGLKEHPREYERRVVAFFDAALRR
jgi:uncharacterized protein